MHIPDGWLSFETIMLTWSFTIVALTLSFSKIKEDDIDKISNIGAIAAVLFVAQMFNFPIAGGTSGHLLGAALAVFVVGLPGAIIALFSVLLVQAVVFADGGIIALGANTFNMGVIGAIIAYAVMKVFSKYEIKRKIHLSGVFLAAFSAVLVSSFFAAVELSASGVVGLTQIVVPVLLWHILIGIGEGVLSVFVIIYLQQVEFPLTDLKDTTNPSLRNAVQSSNKPLLGLGILTLILSILSLFASSSPDGLEFVGQKLDLPAGSTFNLGIADDYAFLGMEGFMGTLISAILGVVILAGILMLPPTYIREKNATLIAV